MKAFDFVPHHKINAKLAALEFDFYFLDSSIVIYLDVINEFVIILSFPILLFFQRSSPNMITTSCEIKLDDFINNFPAITGYLQKVDDSRNW